jgi:hypothetical protein
LIEKGLFNLGLKDKVTKWLNPDATTADLGDKMEAYYDEKLKVWVFPGEDPVERAKPIGPPPVAVAVVNDKNDATTATTPTMDPLAAMMAPPKRGPSALSRSRTPTSIRPSPASMPVMFPMGLNDGTSAQPSTKFNVFTPPAVHITVGNTTTGSYDAVSRVESKS